MAVRESGRGRASIGHRRAERTQVCYDLVYLDDNNKECEVPEDEVRLTGNVLQKEKEKERVDAGGGAWRATEEGRRVGREGSVAMAKTDGREEKVGVEVTISFLCSALFRNATCY